MIIGPLNKIAYTDTPDSKDAFTDYLKQSMLFFKRLFNLFKVPDSLQILRFYFHPALSSLAS
jgi:hypothetical protein